MFVPGVSDIIKQPMYDTQPILFGAVTNLLTFFQVPVGAGASCYGPAAIPKTYADTNIDSIPAIPANYAFNIMAFRIAFPWNIALVDMQNTFNGAFVQFWVGSKPFLTTRLTTIPGGNGPSGFGGAGVILNNGLPALQNGFTLKTRPLPLSATESFRFEIRWPAANAVVAGAYAAFWPVNSIPVTVYMDGDWKRPGQ
jgi:hypothetical protein